MVQPSLKISLLNVLVVEVAYILFLIEGHAAEAPSPNDKCPGYI